MFYRSSRRSPIPVILAVVALLWIGSQLGSAAGGLAFLFVLPFLILKFFFIMFLFGMAMKFFGGRNARRRWATSGPERPTTRPKSENEREWDEHLRAARSEVEGMFPDVDLDRLRNIFRPDASDDAEPASDTTSDAATDHNDGTADEGDPHAGDGDQAM
ncbi:MAG: hypothetical protein ACR2P0_10305 [Acidimicrobiales bacterium]